jgi:hypothetical protein
VTGDLATVGSNRRGLSSIIAALDPILPGTIWNKNMAEPAAPTTSRPSRSRSKEPRAATVSTETENKLARAARSAQRLAELSDVPTDDSTLDLFPDDPTRAALEAMNIDVRQGTLTGFELPDEVLAAVEAATNGEGAPGTPPETKAARRNARAAQADEAVRTTQPQPDALSVGVGQDTATKSPSCFGLELPEPGKTAAGVDVPQAKIAEKPAAQDLPSPTAPPGAQPMAAASALRNAATPRPVAGDTSAEPTGKPETSPLPQRLNVFADKAPGTSRSAGNPLGMGAASAAAAADAAQPQSHSFASASRMPFGSTFGAAGGPSASAQAAPRVTPELDHARAAAFADTVDALYGVIADQRRAAADHSRRMKRMLSVVVGVLLVTVAIGVAQMLLLVRLTDETTVQQQRIEQMVLGQQATLATLMQTQASAATSPPPAAPAAPAVAAVNADSPTPAAPRQPTDARPPAKTQHAHKHRPATATATHPH